MTQATSRKISEWPSTLTLLPNTALVPLTSSSTTYALPKEHINPEIVAVLSATDSTGATNLARLQAAYDLLNSLGGGTLSIGPGTFKLSSGARMYSNTHTRMSSGTVLDISAAGAVTALYAAGAESATMSLTANVSKGETSFSLSAPNAATLAQGDWVRVCSNAVFDASNTNSEIGEIVKVKSVSGTTVNIEGAFRGGAYNTADTAVATKITAVSRVRVTGGAILGGGTPTTVGSDADCTGIKISLGTECIIENVRFSRCDQSGVWFQDSTFCEVNFCHFQDAINDSEAYGVLWDNACQDCTMLGCTGSRVRHLVTTGNSTATKGIGRRINITDCKVFSTSTARAGTGGDAFDTHGGAEDVIFSGCTVFCSTGSGFNIECASARVSNCEAYYTTDYGIFFHNETDQEGEVTIENCRVVKATLEGIRVNMPIRGSTAAIRSIVVAGNEVLDTTSMGIYIVNSAGSGNQRNCTVADNTVAGVATSGGSIYLENVECGAVTGNTVGNPGAVDQLCIRLRDCKSVVVSGNCVKHASSSTGAGFYVNATGAGSCTALIFTGNTVAGDTPVSLRGFLLDNNATNCTIGKNFTTDCNTPFTRGTGTGHDIVDDTFQTAANTITSGVITINRNRVDVIVDTEGAAATDDLDTINGGTRGQIIVLRSNTSARDPTIKDGTGNMLLAGDFTLATSAYSITLMYTGSSWIELARSVN